MDIGTASMGVLLAEIAGETDPKGPVRRAQARPEPDPADEADRAAAPVPESAGEDPGDDDADAVHRTLIESLAASLYMEPDAIHVDKKFLDLGLDSIVGVEWIRTVNQRFNTDIAVNAVYTHPDIRSFARMLMAELPQAQDSRPPRHASLGGARRAQVS